MNFKLAASLFALPSLVWGESTNLRGDFERELKVKSVAGFEEKLESCNGAVCGVWGDPHIVTCDGAAYDCQGLGLFNMMENHMFSIQGNFVSIREEDKRKHTQFTHGASITNDVIIDFLPNDDYPIVQFGFGDFGPQPVFTSEIGCNKTFYWDKHFHDPHWKKNFIMVSSVFECRDLCASDDYPDCEKFNYWGNGKCQLSPADATRIKQHGSWALAISGTMDEGDECGMEHNMPNMTDDLENERKGRIGRGGHKGGKCPLLMWLDGELQDISKSVGNEKGYLVGDAKSDFSIYEFLDILKLKYKTSSGDIAQINLVQGGNGPNEEWSCNWRTYVCLPDSEEDQFVTGTSLGLMGSPDGNSTNDWMDKDGNPLELKNIGPDARKDSYDYCVDNWCVSQEDSMMAYTTGMSYEDVKCQNETYTDDHLDDCTISVDEINTFCAEVLPILRYACEIDCCAGGCGDVKEIEKEFNDLKEFKNDTDKPDYEIPDHDQCDGTEFLNTGDTVCPGASESIVKVLRSSSPLPEGEIIYGIVPDVDPLSIDVQGTNIKLRVNNPFADGANIYVKHDKNAFGSFLDPTCEPMLEVDNGCDKGAVEILVACHEYSDVNAFALVEVYFSSTDIPSSETEVDQCCDAEENSEAGVVQVIFQIDCLCPDAVVE